MRLTKEAMENINVGLQPIVKAVKTLDLQPIIDKYTKFSEEFLDTVVESVRTDFSENGIIELDLVMQGDTRYTLTMPNTTFVKHAKAVYGLEPRKKMMRVIGGVGKFSIGDDIIKLGYFSKYKGDIDLKNLEVLNARRVYGNTYGLLGIGECDDKTILAVLHVKLESTRDSLNEIYSSVVDVKKICECYIPTNFFVTTKPNGVKPLDAIVDLFKTDKTLQSAVLGAAHGLLPTDTVESDRYMRAVITKEVIESVMRGNSKDLVVELNGLKKYIRDIVIRGITSKHGVESNFTFKASANHKNKFVFKFEDTDAKHLMLLLPESISCYLSEDMSTAQLDEVMKEFTKKVDEYISLVKIIRENFSSYNDSVVLTMCEMDDVRALFYRVTGDDLIQSINEYAEKIIDEYERERRRRRNYATDSKNESRMATRIRMREDRD